MDNNLFDDDDALDYLLYTEEDKAHRDGSDNNNRGGCLGIVVLLVLLPAAWRIIWRGGL